VIDPAGGSWFVESLTDQLADKAWGVFTRIEQVGGALAALNSGAIGELLAQTEAHRADDVAHRQAPITGVSEFAFVDEAPVERESAPTPPHGLLPAIRYAQDFEALRDRADAAPQRLYVHLATVGQSSARRIRAGFAANLFQAAGVKCVTASVQDYAGATPVVCLCGSDEDYAAEGATAAASVRAAGARHIWLAGHAEIDGVDGTLFDGCDALDVLRTTLDVLGAPQ
jgi:methylmalonyl-CoA mutase